MKTYKITLTKPNAFFTSATCDNLDEFIFSVSVIFPYISKKCFLKFAKFVKILVQEVFIFHLIENLLLKFFNFIN